MYCRKGGKTLKSSKPGERCIPGSLGGKGRGCTRCRQKASRSFPCAGGVVFDHPTEPERPVFESDRVGGCMVFLLSVDDFPGTRHEEVDFPLRLDSVFALRPHQAPPLLRSRRETPSLERQASGWGEPGLFDEPRQPGHGFGNWAPLLRNSGR